MFDFKVLVSWTCLPMPLLSNTLKHLLEGWALQANTEGCANTAELWEIKLGRSNYTKPIKSHRS